MFFLRSFFLFFFTSLYFCYGGIPKNALMNSDGGPSHALLDVLDAFCLSHDGSWESIKEETQKKWLNGSKERWEFDAIEDREPNKTYCLFSNLCMTQAFYPVEKNYDYGVILGATVQRVRDRFWFLKSVWEQGVRFRTLVILTGDRPLAKEIENENTLLNPESCPYPFRKGWSFDGNYPKNETEMTKLVFDQLALPEEWRQMAVFFVDTPKPKNARRPNTADTFDFWMWLKPCPGKILSVSDQPFMGRQNLVAQKHLDEGFGVETIGKGFSIQEYEKQKNGFTILLDELARWIYELVDGANTASSFNKCACL